MLLCADAGQPSGSLTRRACALLLLPLLLEDAAADVVECRDGRHPRWDCGKAWEVVRRALASAVRAAAHDDGSLPENPSSA